MARVPQPKSRIRLLADALAAVNKANEALAQINLRETPKGLVRVTVKEARSNCTDLVEKLSEAIRADVPSNITPPRKAPEKKTPPRVDFTSPE